MSLARFRHVVKSAPITGRQKEWFPRWLDAFRRFQNQSPVDVLPADRDTVVAFLVSLKQSGRPAWTRWQAAQAIDLYRRQVLMSDDAVLADVLARLGENEVKEYLSSLATERNVAASTQNQAFSALTFLFRDSPAGRWLRHPHGAGTARTCGCEHDDDLYACVEQTWTRHSQPGRCVCQP